MQFVVLSSSRGTTFQAVLDRIADGSLTAQCLGLVSDREDRGCVSKARAAGISVAIVERTAGEDREKYDQKLYTTITNFSTDPTLVIAAIGWMFILSPGLVSRFHGRILNVHPALLPKHPGGHAIRDALAAGDEESGMTIHVIDEGVDTGPILVQKKCSVIQGESDESLKEKIQELEKEWYPKVLQMIEWGEITLP